MCSRLSTWLLRPYLDLGALHMGPLHVSVLEECWRAFIDPRRPGFVPQRVLPSGFRAQLAEEAGGPPYAPSDPRELPEVVRTDRWRALCDGVESWRGLSQERKCRLAVLLHCMCFYRPLVTLIPEAGFEARRADPDAVQLAFWRASAKYMDGLPNRTSDYDDADTSVFEDIALNAQHCAPTVFIATAKVFVHKAKTGAELAELAEWSKHLEKAHARATRGVDEFTTELFTSKFYRGTGFLPQRLGDRSEVVRTMDLAERHALKMKPLTPGQELLYRENLHAVMESRTKEALWLGDMEQALARSLKVIDVDPYDSKAWAELGEVRYLRKEWQEAAQAYAVAAMLGPPASAVGRHMAGVCLRELDQNLLAALLFKDTLELDPLGISPREEIHSLPDLAVLEALKAWSRVTTK